MEVRDDRLSPTTLTVGAHEQAVFYSRLGVVKTDNVRPAEKSIRLVMDDAVAALTICLGAVVANWRLLSDRVAGACRGLILTPPTRAISSAFERTPTFV